jgi:hypothetical protein
VNWSGLEWAILESAPLTRLVRVTDPPSFDPRTFPVGMAFGDRRELRWRKRRGGLYHLVSIDEDEGTLDEETARVLTELHRETIRLWGEARGDAWHEARIPRRIDEYDGFQGSAVGVELVHYEMEGEGGPVFLYRCRRLVKVKP